MEITIHPNAEQYFQVEFDNRAKMLKSYMDKSRAGASVTGEMQSAHSAWLQNFKQVCLNYVHVSGYTDADLISEFKRVVQKYLIKSRIPGKNDYNYAVTHHTLLSGHGKVPRNLQNMVILCAGTARVHQVDLLPSVNGIKYSVGASVEILHGGDDSITLMTCMSSWEGLNENQQAYYKRSVDKIVPR